MTIESSAAAAADGLPEASFTGGVEGMKVIINRVARLLDDYFKVDEAVFCYERFDGEMSGPVRRLCFDRGDSVAAIVFNRDRQNVILVEQFRYPAFRKGDGWTVELVAGVIQVGETAEVTLRREVREEIGYTIDRLHPIANFFLSPGASSERIMLYCAEVTNAGKIAAGGGLAEEGEDIRIVELSLSELRQQLDQARIRDAKTLVGTMWLLDQVRDWASGEAVRE
jgi:nudix-type nucleoside diphosphatase (YffH/AdpP family)